MPSLSLHLCIFKPSHTIDVCNAWRLCLYLYASASAAIHLCLYTPQGTECYYLNYPAARTKLVATYECVDSNDVGYRREADMATRVGTAHDHSPAVCCKTGQRVGAVCDAFMKDGVEWILLANGYWLPVVRADGYVYGACIAGVIIP
jgi:hypothetical protein